MFTTCPWTAQTHNAGGPVKRFGIVAETVNSMNRDDWDGLFAAIDNDEIDLLLISPERLNNPEFRSGFLLHVSIGPDIIFDRSLEFAKLRSVCASR